MWGWVRIIVVLALVWAAVLLLVASDANAHKIVVNYSSQPVAVVALGHQHTDVITGTAWSPGDTLRGLYGADVLRGGGSTDIIYGNRGYDTLSGGSGGDMLIGGPGNDVLYGGPGNDYCEGGYGLDIYRDCEQTNLVEFLSLNPSISLQLG